MASNIIKEVYLIYAQELNLYKIGISKNSSKRIKQLQTGCPYKLSILKVFKSIFVFEIETSLHNRFSHCKSDINTNGLNGEWFMLNNNDIINFLNTCQEINDNLIFLKKNSSLLI